MPLTFDELGEASSYIPVTVDFGNGKTINLIINPDIYTPAFVERHGSEWLHSILSRLIISWDVMITKGALRRLDRKIKIQELDSDIHNRELNNQLEGIEELRERLILLQKEADSDKGKPIDGELVPLPLDEKYLRELAIPRQQAIMAAIRKRLLPNQLSLSG